MGAAGDHVDCPKCGTEVVLINDPARVLSRAELNAMPASEIAALNAQGGEQRVPDGLWKGMTPAEVDADRAAAAELLAGGARYISPRMELTIDVTALGGTRANMALFLGGFVEALLDGAHGVEVRVRRREGTLTLQGNVYLPGGRRIEDSQRALEDEVVRLREPLDAGHQRGEAVARVLDAARPT
jgi:hypothetical protein